MMANFCQFQFSSVYYCIPTKHLSTCPTCSYFWRNGGLSAFVSRCCFTGRM